MGRVGCRGGTCKYVPIRIDLEPGQVRSDPESSLRDVLRYGRPHGDRSEAWYRGFEIFVMYDDGCCSQCAGVVVKMSLMGMLDQASSGY